MLSLNKNKKKNQDGFTLIELLVVVAIIGILATIVLVSLNTARMKARDVRRVADLRQVALALEMYYDDNTSTGYPGSSGSNQWDPCGGSNALEDALEPNYMASVPCDPGTETYEYWVAPSKNGYVLKAALENPDNPALDNDVEGDDVLGCDCDDPNYCLEM